MPCGMEDHIEYKAWKKARLTDDQRGTEHVVFDEAREVWSDQIIQGPQYFFLISMEVFDFFTLIML